MANPILTQAQNHQGMIYSGRRLTLDDVLIKTIVQFTILLPVAAAAYMFMPAIGMSPALIGSMIATLVLGIIINIMTRPSPALIMFYAVLEGIFVGTISKSYSMLYDGIVPTAVMAATVTAAVIIMGVKMGFLRTSGKIRKIFAYACIGYLVFTLVAVGASLLGLPILTLGSPLAIAVSIFGTIMASVSLIIDVENISENVRHGAPEELSWKLAFGLTVSLVWLYLEILRLIANFSSIFSD